METFTEIQPFDLLSLSKSSADEIANAIIENILEGGLNPRLFAVKKKLIEQALSKVMENEGVKNMTIKEIEDYKTDNSVLGAKVTVVNRADYKYENDPIWKSIKNQLEPLEKDLKVQQELIKMCCRTGHSMVNDKTGEMVASVVPAPQTTSVMVSFSKK